jgi:hypothetical protein
MTKEEFNKSVKKFVKDTKTYSESVPTAYKSFALPRISTQRDKLFALILAKDWNGLIAECRSACTEVESKFAALKTEQNNVNKLFNKAFLLKDGIVQHYKTPNRQAFWDDLRTLMLNKMLDAGVAQNDAETFLDTIGEKGGLNVYNYYKKELNQLSDLLDEAEQRHIAKYMYNYAAIALAKYNIASAVSQTPSFNVSTKITSIGNGILTRQNNLYQRAKINNKAGVISYAKSFDAWLSQRIDNEINTILAYSYQKLSAANNSFQVDGRRALKAGVLLQNALYAKALCRWLIWICKWHDECKSSSEFSTNAAKLSNSPVAWSGTDTAISAISSNPAAHDNSDVIVEGIISNLKIKHVNAVKVISTADINDANNQSVKLTLPHFKLDSGGLVNGSYARLAGKFLQSNPEAQGQPAISLDRLAYKSLSGRNWNAWLRYQLRNMFEVPAHNIAVEFSLKPGKNGAINPIKYDTTYSKPNLLTIENNIF